MTVNIFKIFRILVLFLTVTQKIFSLLEFIRYKCVIYI